MPKILIIPDVHGRDFWRKPVSRIEDYQEVIFLGDYLDPYETREHISREVAFDEFVDIMKLKTKHPDKVTLLLGNHDLHYLWPNSMHCSRKYYDKVSFYNKLLRQSIRYFTLMQVRQIAERQYVFTHAGLLHGWLKSNKYIATHYLAEIENGHYDSFARLINGMLQRDEPGILAQAAKARSGHHEYGSLVWADVNEHQTNQQLKGTFQIFGHTLKSTPIITPDWACLDCRNAFELDTTDGSLRMLPL